MAPLEEIYASRVIEEYREARRKYKPIRSPHEGLGLIQEEFEEFKQAIYDNDISHAKKEAIQTAAMLIAFCSEVSIDPYDTYLKELPSNYWDGVRQGYCVKCRELRFNTKGYNLCSKCEGILEAR